MIADFQWKYPGYQSNINLVPKKEEYVEWLSLMQHFGTKTRMLDFSESIYVALYMALSGISRNDAAIWALNKEMIYSPVREELRSANPLPIVFENDVEARMYEEINNVLSSWAIHYSVGQPSLHKLYIVRPKICNERLSRQQGVFVIPSIVTESFETILSSYCDINNPIDSSLQNVSNIGADDTSIGLIKFVIPNVFRYELTRALMQMNISAETMFPGLEGLAQSINCLRVQDGPVN